jgi:hypothetical protein
MKLPALLLRLIPSSLEGMTHRLAQEHGCTYCAGG